MPAANLLTDHGVIAAPTNDRQAVMTVGAQDVPTMSGGANDNTAHTNVHVALIFLLAIGFVMVLRKSGVHGIMLEG